MHVVEVQVASEAHLAERRHVLVKLIEFVVLLEERFDAGPARLQGAGRAEQTDGARQHPHAGDAECREGDQGRAAPARTNTKTISNTCFGSSPRKPSWRCASTD